MIIECTAIILIILVMAFMTYRYTQKTGWCAGMLPLLIVPAGHICGTWFCGFISSLLGITPATAWIALDLISLMITCLLLGAISLQIKRKRTRMAYLVTCGGYSAILTCVLIVRSVLPLLLNA